jgi:hypothetical protein
MRLLSLASLLLLACCGGSSSPPENASPDLAGVGVDLAPAVDMASCKGDLAGVHGPNQLAICGYPDASFDVTLCMCTGDL